LVTAQYGSSPKNLLPIPNSGQMIEAKTSASIPASKRLCCRSSFVKYPAKVIEEMSPGPPGTTRTLSPNFRTPERTISSLCAVEKNSCPLRE
jgi:hypothetical protein